MQTESKCRSHYSQSLSFRSMKYKSVFSSTHFSLRKVSFFCPTIPAGCAAHGSQEAEESCLSNFWRRKVIAVGTKKKIKRDDQFIRALILPTLFQVQVRDNSWSGGESKFGTQADKLLHWSGRRKASSCFEPLHLSRTHRGSFYLPASPTFLIFF